MIVYRHRREDTNSIFYIGMGKKEIRAYCKYKRNSHWNNITNKTDYSIEIVARDLSREDAIELEMFLIETYGRDNLCNMTDGGEGRVNSTVSLSVRKKVSNANKGNTYFKGKKHKESSKELISRKNSKKIINTETGEIYNSAKELAEKIGMNVNTLRTKLNGSRRNNTVYKYN